MTTKTQKPEAAKDVAKVKGTEAAKEVKAPKSESKKEVKPSAAEELQKQNAEGTVKKITDKKDLKYKYGEEDDTLSKRKKFRAKVRATIKQFTKKVTTLTNIPEDKRTPDQVKELDKLEKDFTKFAKKNLAHKKAEAEA